VSVPPEAGARRDRLQDLAGRVERLGMVRRWNRRWAHGLLAILDAAMLGAMLVRQSQAFGFLLVACAAFVVLMVMEAFHPCLSRRAVLWSCVVVLAVAVVAAPRDSDDVWSYAMYGHMVVQYHANPYTVSPLAYSGDPWFWRVSVWWQDTRTVYGPVFTGLSAIGMHIAGSSALRARLFFQGLTAASVLGALALLNRRGADAGALAFLGLSPLIVVNVVNGGHNDALVGLAALAAVVALSKRLRLVAGILIGLGALVKLIALLPAGALAIWFWHREDRRSAVTFAAAVGVVVAAGYLLIGGFGALAPLQEASRLVNHWSVWGWLGHKAPGSPTGEGPLGGLVIPPVPKLLLTGATRYLGTVVIVGLSALCMVAWGRDRRPSAGAAATILAFVLATSYIQPWYLAGMVPLLALQWRSRLALLGTGYGVLVLLADAWQSSTGLLRILFRIPLSTIFPAFQALALLALALLAVQRIRQPVLPVVLEVPEPSVSA
jgi:alpha-1,6-mannosyltransferase